MPPYTKKNDIPSIDDVYALLGVTRHHISRWRSNPYSTLARNSLKHDAVTKAAEIFTLTSGEAEALANKAGLSLCSDGSFTKAFNAKLKEFPRSDRYLCEMSMVSERMLRHIKHGNHIRKEPLTALAVSLCGDLAGVQELMKRAGFILSNSMPGDIVVMWTLRNCPHSGENNVFLMNETPRRTRSAAADDKNVG